MAGSLTRIRNNQVSTAVSGNTILGINASQKVQPYTVTGGLLANSLTYGSDLTITGNLTINGTTTAVNTTTTTIEDPVITLASTAVGTPVSDIGFLGQRGSSTNVAWVWKESALEFESVYTSTGNVSNGSPTVTVTGFANIHMGNANIGGNAVHNGTTSFVGNILGTASFTANVVAGNVLTPGLISATGNVYGANFVGNVVATSISTSGNITGGNLLTGGLISATGTITSAANVIGGNITTAGQVSATANITGGNVLTAGLISATGTITSAANVIGGNITTAGQVSATGTVTGGNVSAVANVIGGNITTVGLISATGTITSAANVIGGNITTAGQVSATANITGGNILTAGLISATGTITSAANVIGGNITTAGQVSASANITGGNILTAGLISSTGTITSAANITGGNILTAGLISATANVTGGNVLTAGQVSATGNLSGGNLSIATNAVILGNLSVAGNVTFTNSNVITTNDLYIELANNATTYAQINGAGLNVGPTGNTLTNWTYNSTSNAWTTNVGISSTGTVTGGNLATAGTISGTGNLTAGNLLSAGLISTTGNATHGNILNSGLYSGVGNVTIPNSSYYFGNGSQLVGVQASTSGFPVSAGNSNIAATTNGNIAITVGGVSNVFTVTTTGIVTSGTSSVTGNITGGNLLTGGLISAAANITGGNLLTGGLISATANITGGNVLTAGIVSATGNLYTANTLTATGTTATGVLAAIFGTANATLHANSVITAAGNANASAQFAFQNSNNGSNASADIAVYNNQGTDTTYFIDMGITSSGFNGTAYAANIYGANDGYLYVVGNSATGPVGSGANIGNLILGSTNGQVIVFVGNASTSNAVTVTGPTGFSVTGIVSATGNIITTNGNVIGGNVVITGNSINMLAAGGTLIHNSSNANVNFAVNGTAANVFFVNASTNTVSFGNSTQTTNAIASFNSSTSILLPVGNVNQRPGTGVPGMLRFNSLNNALEIYNNTTWQSVGATQYTTIVDEQFNGDGTNTIFTLATANLTSAATLVSINGIVQIPTGNVAGAYAVTGNSTASVLTFTEAPAVGDQIDVRELATTSTVSAIYNNQSQIIANGAAGQGELDITGNIIPTSNAAFTLGSATNTWKSLYVSGSTIYLGGLQLQSSGNTFSVYTSDGSTLANIGAAGLSVTSITDGTSAYQFAGINGNAVITAGGSNTMIVTSSGTVTTGTASVTGNITGGNISATNHTGTTVSVSGNVTGGNLLTGGLISATGTITSSANVIGGNITTASQVSAGGNITGGNLLTAGIASVGGNIVLTGNIIATGNAVANIGSLANQFNYVFARATSAQYADLAEMYAGDAAYEPGTVVDFGGDEEVTLSTEDMSSAVAGVVSTNPSYLMNSGLVADNTVAVALTGRVPTRVTGPVAKGDLMVSAGDGTARSEEFPAVGTVIGKALANFDGDVGVIEVVVGRF